MKAVLSFALLAVVAGLAAANIQTRFIDLRVDHFNPLDRRTFDGRYFVNSEHYLAGGPIFVYVSGGFETYDEYLARGAVFEIAEDTRGHLFALEPRFYGESRPTEDTSVDNLRFLTIHQQLADLAQFISFIRANYFGAENSRVILWGRGYGGSLAIWARQKYPNLVDGVWASSAPINAVEFFPQLHTNAFYTITSIGDTPCGAVIDGAFRFIEEAVRTRNTTYVEERLRLCSPIDTEIAEDVARLNYGIAAEVALQFVSNAQYPDIDEKCRIMLAETSTPENQPENNLDAFARWFVDEWNGNLECLDYNNTAVTALYQQTAWNTVSTIAGRRQNFWLQCTQLGQFGIANEGTNHPFGWRFDAEFFRLWCAQAFDSELITEDFMTESIARTNQFFGGLNPHVYRVFFTHGEMDPRRSLGPQEDINPNSPVVVMALQSHGRDFGSPAETDYAVLQYTKARARELILQWIVDAAQELPPGGDGETTTPGGPIPGEEF